MTPGEFRELLFSLARGWSERRYEEIAERFAENVFYSDATGYAFVDRASLLAFFRDDEQLDQSCTFHNVVFDESQQLGTAEYTYRGSFLYHGTVWVRIADGRIQSWREYQHKSVKDWNEFWQGKVNY